MIERLFCTFLFPFINTHDWCGMEVCNVFREACGFVKLSKRAMDGYIDR